jgi:uncharacterized 2Fe-2S/4Fe-4S cluster protein (DUF4445 family)
LHLNNRQAAVSAGKSLFEIADELAVPVPTSCRKQGKCKECMVEVVEGMECLSLRDAAEKHLREGFRLSCCARVVGDSGTIRCHTMRRGEMRIERHAFELPVRSRSWTLDPAVTRAGDRILLDGREIAVSDKPIHGIAMDLGTTTIVLRLFNLETGEVIADASFENPQRFGGSDVMSRIQYDSEDGTRLLQRTLAGYLAHAIDEFPVDPNTIYEMVVAGNSTMRDLFFKLSVYSIGQSPYRSITELEMQTGLRASTTLSDTAHRLGLHLHPEARVYGLPIISGHVGADAAACMLAVDIANEERIIGVMDIGTNTELVLGNRHKILAASCPAGPAFEGGKISCGMPGLPGAIEKVKLHEHGEFSLGVIGNGEPEGICGSGLVDLLSELLLTGRINSLGRFEHGEDRIDITATAPGKVFFTESDINELAQAKGANVAGLRVIFNDYGIAFDEVDAFYLAGGFGRHLNVESSKRIGLIPNIPGSKIVQAGNASIEGACIALLSMQKRRELETLVRRVQHCRLETHPGFFDFFVDGCQFKPVDASETKEAAMP